MASLALELAILELGSCSKFAQAVEGCRHVTQSLRRSDFDVESVWFRILTLRGCAEYLASSGMYMMPTLTSYEPGEQL